MVRTNAAVCPPEDHPHPPDDQPIELEAPVAGGEGGQSKLSWKTFTRQPIQFKLRAGKIVISVQTVPE